MSTLATILLVLGGLGFLFVSVLVLACCLIAKDPIHN